MTAPVTSSQAPAYTKVRNAAQASGLAKKIFGSGNGGMTTLQITSSMRTAFALVGITLPKGANITLDMAQMILAGGVFVNDVETGASIASCASPAAIAVSATVDLLSQIGWLDPQYADFASLGINLTLAITSYGTNVIADIGTIIALIKVTGDLKRDFGGDAKKAKKAAADSLISGIHAIFDPEIAYASTQIALYNAGQLNPFDLIANVALNAPDEFADFFPSLKTYFPTWGVMTLTSTGTSKGWTSSKTDVESITFVRLLTTKQQIENILIKKYLINPMQQYAKDQISDTCISLKALSVLSMLLSTATGQAVAIGFDFDIVSACVMLGVTPSILGDDWLFEGGLSHEAAFNGTTFDPDSMLPYTPVTLQEAGTVNSTGGLVINGVAQLSDADKKVIDYRNKLKAFQFAMYQADKLGNMDALAQNPEGAALLKEWATIDITPTWDDTSREPLGMSPKTGAIPISFQPWFDYDVAQTVGRKPPPEPVQPANLVGSRLNTAHVDIKYDNVQQYIDYVKQYYTIDLSNYWKSLQTLQVMRSSNLFKDDPEEFDVWGDLDAIQDLFKKVYTFVLAKNMNRTAENNVATYLGTTSDKLGVRLDSKGNKVYFIKAGA